MKKKNNKYMLLFIFFLVFAILLFSYLVIKTSKKTAVDLNHILENLTEYNNPTYLNTLSTKQKKQLIDSLEQTFYDICSNKDKCSIPFLFVYMDIKLNSGLSPDEILSGKEYIITSVYSDLSHNLTEYELKGFKVPFLIDLCKVGFLNQSEKIFWGRELSKFPINYKSILYFNECLGINTISDLKKIYEIEEKSTCITLPTLDVTDCCQLFINLRVLNFCENEEIKNNSFFYEKSIVNFFLSKEYKSFYEENCKNSLSKLYEENN